MWFDASKSEELTFNISTFSKTTKAEVTRLDRLISEGRVSLGGEDRCESSGAGSNGGGLGGSGGGYPAVLLAMINHTILVLPGLWLLLSPLNARLSLLKIITQAINPER